MINWDDFKNEKVAVWCDTEEKAKEFVEECFKRDISYFDRSKETDWYNYEENMCYCIIGSNLCYESKSFFIGDGYKIIKWESENMKFKVGDRVKAISGSTYYNKGDVGIITVLNATCARVKFDTSRYFDGIWWIDLDKIEKIEEQTEFTFQEVIARIKPGEVYESLKGIDIDTEIALTGLGISISYFKDGKRFGSFNGGITITYQNKFKLQEPKKKYVLHGIEHQEDGKIYFFRSKEDKVIPDTTLVICNTSKGKSYGRAVQRVEKELTESEYKQYKECWRA